MSLDLDLLGVINSSKKKTFMCLASAIFEEKTQVIHDKDNF
jgi:hypothetical protein